MTSAKPWWAVDVSVTEMRRMVVARAGLCGQVLSALDGTMRCAEVGMKPVLPLAGHGLGVGIGDGWMAGPT